MLLNRKYYQDLWDKYQNIEPLTKNLHDKFSVLTFKIILEHCRNKKSLHINFQNSDNTFQSLAKELFVELSNEIFCNAADFPPYNAGDKVKSKIKMRVGKPKPLHLDFIVKKKANGKFSLYNEKFEITLEKNFDELLQQFIPLTQNAQNETLLKFLRFFDKLNSKQVHDFYPTYFESKSVFIAPKTFYDSLEAKNKIPTTYFPNTREENNLHETKSIPALPDAIMYFVPKYKVCYEKILLQGKKVHTVVVYDTEETEIEQIVQDKNRFGFNLIVLTKQNEPIKCSQIPCWNWYKEETELVNML